MASQEVPDDCNVHLLDVLDPEGTNYLTTIDCIPITSAAPPPSESSNLPPLTEVLPDITLTNDLTSTANPTSGDSSTTQTAVSPTSSVPSPSFTTTTTPTGGPSPTSTGLPPGAIAGISIGAIAGVLIIALVGFLLGRRRGSKRRPSTNDHAAVLGVEGPVREYKGGKDGQNRSLADREGRGVARWWGKKFDKNVDAKGTTEAGQQGKGSNVVVHKTGVAIDDLPEFRSNGRLLLGTLVF